jgi:purine-binding chemotaxis protein CheW
MEKMTKNISPERKIHTACKEKSSIERAELLNRKKILKLRAEELAEEPKKDLVIEKGLEIVTFMLADEIYGIESSFVREVIHLKSVTQLPCTPSFVFGITNVRGKLVSIIDLKDLLELPVRGIKDLNRVLIVQTKDLELGLLTDDIGGVKIILSHDLQPSLPALAGILSEYMQGITEQRLIVLDIKKILADTRIIVNEKVKR